MDDDRRTNSPGEGRAAAGSHRGPALNSSPLFQAPEFRAPDPPRPREEQDRPREEPAHEEERPSERSRGRSTGRPARPPEEPSVADTSPAAIPEKPRTPEKPANSEKPRTPEKPATSKKAAPARKVPAKKAASQPIKRATRAESSPADIPAPAKKAAKKTAVKQTAPAAPPAEESAALVRTLEEAEPSTTATVPAEARRSLSWDRLRTNPGYAPELLALAAVAELGPRARDWARELRARYPSVSTEGLVRLATRRCTQLASMAGATGVTVTGASAPVAGVVGLFAEFSSLAWAQARMVLQVAAAYGEDPTDPERAVDLLVLIRVHPSVETARAALATAAQEASAPTSLTDARGLVEEALWRLAAPLSTRTSGWAVRRLAARFLPGAGLLLAVSGATARTERLAARAISHYRQAARAS
jgi:hypothetical protein